MARDLVDLLTVGLVHAALAAAAADWAADSRIAVETGLGLGPELLQYCAALIDPSAGPKVVAIVRPPAEGDCLAAPWHARQMRTIVLLAETADPISEMARAASRAGCTRLLLADLPQAAASGTRLLGEFVALDVRQPFLRPEFADALHRSAHPLADLASARTQLARRVFDPDAQNSV